MKGKDEMKEKLKFIIANCCSIDTSAVDDNAKVNETPNWDSFGHLQIMSCVEQEFGVSFDTRTISALLSYKDILGYLKENT
ncbi:MAG: acyl carrier protein [Candidatus Omnitrophota bacterium]|nr:acyl carrier protein [Candidatus Omnitrophota bacterium]